MRKPSILQDVKECYLTGRTDNLHTHHIFFGTGNKKVSDENGFWVWLTGKYHNQDSGISVHHNRYFDLTLKMKCQAKFEEMHSREEFIKLIGRNYL